MIVWDQSPKQLLQQLVFRTKEFQHKLPDRQRISCSSSSSWSRPDCSSLLLPTWVGKCSRLISSGTLKRCCLYRWILVFTILDRWQKACVASRGSAICWCQCNGSSGPWRRWGYVGRRMLWTTNRYILLMFEMLWIGVYDSVFQFLPISSNLAQPLKKSEATFHRPRSTTWSIFCEVHVFHCMRQMVATPEPPANKKKRRKLLISGWHFIVASQRHTCAIVMLSN